MLQHHRQLQSFRLRRLHFSTNSSSFSTTSVSHVTFSLQKCSGVPMSSWAAPVTSHPDTSWGFFSYGRHSSVMLITIQIPIEFLGHINSSEWIVEDSLQLIPPRAQTLQTFQHKSLHLQSCPTLIPPIATTADTLEAVSLLVDSVMVELRLTLFLSRSDQGARGMGAGNNNEFSDFDQNNSGYVVIIAESIESSNLIILFLTLAQIRHGRWP